MPTPFEKLLQRRIRRRKFLATAFLTTGYLALSGASLASNIVLGGSKKSPPFIELPHSLDKTDHIAEGFERQILLRWGDAVLKDAPAFEPKKMDFEAQKKQFGYNNDFTAFMPLPKGSEDSTHGLLCVNHEYTIGALMYPSPSDAQLELAIKLEMAAHGHSVVEIQKTEKGWAPVSGEYNRRFNALDTVFEISGPAAGHARLKTKADHTGTRVIGTVGNCAGGVTPWGTVLVAEENFNEYFAGDNSKTTEQENYRALGIGGHTSYKWHERIDRFNLEKEPNEANRFGWVWEYNPYDPESKPTKRTALGRFKHEGATVTLSPDNRAVVYSGDDEAFQYIYKFVSKNAYNPANPNPNLLDEGTLYVAKFTEKKVTWLPLVYGTAPLNDANRFFSQADVVIEARRAAKLLGATPMDRPEDVEVSPIDGRVYFALTNNTRREAVDGANPRPDNAHGHIIALTPPDKDHTATDYTWDIFILAGNPYDQDDKAFYPGKVSKDGWFSCPDNLAFDPKGNLWIATDGQPHTIGAADGLYVTACEGEERGTPYHLYNAPKGAEVTGPCFTPDGTTLFLSIQHPADGLISSLKSLVSFSQISDSWPDFSASMPPRPSVIAIQRKNGKQLV